MLHKLMQQAFKSQSITSSITSFIVTSPSIKTREQENIFICSVDIVTYHVNATLFLDLDSKTRSDGCFLTRGMRQIVGVNREVIISVHS